MTSSRMTGSALFRHLGPRLFSAASVEPSCTLLLSPSRAPAPLLLRLLAVRMASTTASTALGGEPKKEDEAKSAADAEKEVATAPPTDRKLVSRYWGIDRYQIAKEDGTSWRWSCFMVSYS